MRAWLRSHCDWESVVIGLLTVMAAAALVIGFGDDTASCSISIESHPNSDGAQVDHISAAADWAFERVLAGMVDR